MTSLLFSHDGATLYIGTEDGDLLVQSLRSTETPKTIAVGDQGCRVEGLAIAVRRRLPIMPRLSLFSHRKRANSQPTSTREQLVLLIINRWRSMILIAPYDRP